MSNRASAGRISSQKEFDKFLKEFSDNLLFEKEIATKGERALQQARVEKLVELVNDARSATIKLSSVVMQLNDSLMPLYLALESAITVICQTRNGQLIPSENRPTSDDLKRGSLIVDTSWTWEQYIDHFVKTEEFTPYEAWNAIKIHCKKDITGRSRASIINAIRVTLYKSDKYEKSEQRGYFRRRKETKEQKLFKEGHEKT